MESKCPEEICACADVSESVHFCARSKTSFRLTWPKLMILLEDSEDPEWVGWIGFYCAYMLWRYFFPWSGSFHFQRTLSHLRKPRVLSQLRSLRKERSGFSTLGLRRWLYPDLWFMYQRMRKLYSHTKALTRNCRITVPMLYRLSHPTTTLIFYLTELDPPMPHKRDKHILMLTTLVLFKVSNACIQQVRCKSPVFRPFVRLLRQP